MPRRLDLSGQTFGFIHVVAPTDRRDGSNIVYRCTCTACGNECFLSTRSLRSAKTKSCGCLRSTHLGDHLGKIVDHAGICDTNSARIRSHRPQKNSTSGVRGVCWTGGQWEATLYYKRKRIRLYRGPDFEKAVQARKDGEALRLSMDSTSHS